MHYGVNRPLVEEQDAAGRGTPDRTGPRQRM